MILDAIIHGISILLWSIGSLLCQLVDWIYGMFEIFTGLDTVTYFNPMTGKETTPYLLNLFFSNSTITKIYWGIAVIGIALTMVFTAWAVIKKMFDSTEKVKNSWGGIATNAFKAILIMLLMTGIVTSSVNAVNILISQIAYVFDNADNLDKKIEITFTDEQYAAMFRCLNTIGNYGLNLNYNSRYNVNACFNEIRPDMQFLDQEGVFDFDYIQYDTGQKSKNGDPILGEMNSWQLRLKNIEAAANIYRQLDLDLYYPTVQTAIVDCMDAMKNDPSFKPIPNRHYRRIDKAFVDDTKPGLIVLLASSIGAANDEPAEQNLMDRARLPYYTESKDAYDLDEIEDGFDIDIGNGWNYIIMFLGALFLLKHFFACLFQAIARMFNLVMLYLISPLAVMTYPMDDGGKFKQWCTSFLIQAFSIFGTIVALRILMLYVPIILSSNLEIYDNGFLNILAKVILICGGAMAASGASGIITGILADNAGMAGMNNVSDMAKAGAAATQVAGKALGAAAAVGMSAAGNVAKGLANVTGLTTATNAIGGAVSKKLSDANKAMKDHGGAIGAIVHAAKSKKAAKAAGAGKDGASGGSGKDGSSGGSGKDGDKGGDGKDQKKSGNGGSGKDNSVPDPMAVAAGRNETMNMPGGGKKSGEEKEDKKDDKEESEETPNKETPPTSGKDK